MSPANTNPTLTRGANPDSPKRPYKTYFRTCTTDSIQGPFAAQLPLTTAGVKKVATIHDKKAYGQGLVEAFTAEFKNLGGKVVAAETINPDDKDYGSVITQVKAANPEAVYYGGEFPQSGPLSQQVKAAGLTVPLMGGDGMYTPKFIKLAGKTAEGDLATSVGAPSETLPSAKAFVDAYAAAGYPEPYEAYGAYSFDAANAIINALKVSLKDAATPRTPGSPPWTRWQGQLRRCDRQGRVRRVRRHHHQGADRLQGRGRRVEAGQDRGVQVGRGTASSVAA